jgi:hypothetical protein
MIGKTPLIATVAAAVLSAGCVTTPPEKYNWGTYDPSLYGYYKSPAKVGELTATLDASLKASDSHNQPAPPGLRAEYGYLLLQQGKNAEAVSAFQTEATQWPESKVFMDHMVKVAESGHSAAQPKEP